MGTMYEWPSLCKKNSLHISSSPILGTMLSCGLLKFKCLVMDYRMFLMNPRGHLSYVFSGVILNALL